MKCFSLVIILYLLPILTALSAYGQSAEEEAIKKACWTESDAYYRRNYAAWKAAWLEDSKVTRCFISKSGVFTVTGSKQSDSATRVDITSNPQPFAVSFKNDNYIIRTNGNLAWVEYDQILTLKDNPTPQLTREYRVLVKDKGQWKLANQLTIDPESFRARDAAVNMKGN